MPKFFVLPGAVKDGVVTIEGEDARHISSALRLKDGDEIVVVSAGMDFSCRIERMADERVFLRVTSSCPTAAEPDIRVSVFAALPKGGKLEEIITRITELGADSITPVLTSRCVARLSEKDFEKKLPRLRAVAKAAAKQSGRGKVPEVHPLRALPEALSSMLEHDAACVLYEAADKGGLSPLISGSPRSIAFLTGPEGGFSIDEIEVCKNAGLNIVGLGKRILRCETAPVCFLSALMYATGNLC